MPQPTDPSSPEISALLTEDRTFPPSAAFTAAAHANDPAVYARAADDPEAFWAGFANELEWITPFTRVLEWASPDAKWFGGGRLNVAANCLDRHVRTARRNKAAIIWEGEPGDRRTLTYFDLYRDVNAFAHVLRGLGVKKGDRVALYMPLIPELAIAMLACARLGAVHSVVFGGFSSESLRDRINDSQCSVLVTADGGYRRGQLVPLKQMADEALKDTPSIRHVVVVQRDQTARFPVHIQEGRDHWYHRLMQDAGRQRVDPEPMDAEDMLYILYTSGTTGKPKGIVHTTAGLPGRLLRHHQVGLRHEGRRRLLVHGRHRLGDRPQLRRLRSARQRRHRRDVRGRPGLAGQGALLADRRALRRDDLLHRADGDPRLHALGHRAPGDVRSLEPAPARIGRRADQPRGVDLVPQDDRRRALPDRRHVVADRDRPHPDLAPAGRSRPPSLVPRPGRSPASPPRSASRAASAVEVGGGLLALTKPWPGMLRGIYGDRERFKKQYFTQWPDGVYFTGDGARRDDDGFYWLLGRVDDVLNVAGHRIGTMEVESALVDHPSVAEAAVVGRAHELKGQAITAFVILKGGKQGSEALVDELRRHVAKKIGAIAKPEDVLFAADLPKTRSGKIMRRLLRDIAEGRALGDTTTLADPAVVAKLKESYQDEQG